MKNIYLLSSFVLFSSFTNLSLANDKEIPINNICKKDNNGLYQCVRVNQEKLNIKDEDIEKSLYQGNVARKLSVPQDTSQNTKIITDAITQYNKDNKSNIVIYNANNKIVYDWQKNDENNENDYIDKNVNKKLSKEENGKSVILFKYNDNGEIRYSLQPPKNKKILEVKNVYQYTDFMGNTSFSYKPPKK